jgi:hypothetical protein
MKPMAPGPNRRPDPWPRDPVHAAARLQLVIAEIDGRDMDDADDLLTHFLRTAWPSFWAQDQ